MSHINNAIDHVSDFTKKHPYATGVVAGCVLLVAAPAVVASPLLGAAGFTASGTQAESLAASVQSGLGSVVAPSLFSTLQSAAIGGYGLSAVAGAIQAVGGVTGAAAGLGAVKKYMKTRQTDEEESADEE